MVKSVIACDLDGTLAEYNGWKGIDHIGDVIKPVRDAIYNAQKKGSEVWIFTARVSDESDHDYASLVISKWLANNKINVMGITSTKHKFFTEFWDDRAFQVVKNEGIFIVEGDNLWLPACASSSSESEVKVKPIFLPEEPRTPTSALDIQEGGQHYKKYAIQPIEFVVRNNIPVLEANALKYVVRHADKNGMEDLRKARHYLELMAEMYYGEKL